MKKKNKHHDFVLLQSIKTGEKFFTLHDPDIDPTKSYNGDIWYKFLDYADTIEEAQIKLYGRSFEF